MMIKKSKKYHMDTKAADATLQNVFAACNQTPNEVPFDKILLRSKMTSRACNICIIICIILFTVTFLLPLTFEKPTTKIQTQDNGSLTLISHTVENNELSLVFSETDFNETACELLVLTADDVNQGTYKAISIDDATGTIVFPFFDVPTSIYVEAEDGSSVTILVTPK